LLFLQSFSNHYLNFPVYASVEIRLLLLYSFEEKIHLLLATSVSPNGTMALYKFRIIIIIIKRHVYGLV